MNVSLQLDPLKELATWEQIKAKRNELESSPIILSNGFTYDYNERTELRLQKALRRFDNLPSVIQYGALPWKLANNSFHPHTKTEFEAVVNEISDAIADRSDRLFSKAEELGANPPTVGELDDLATWGL